METNDNTELRELLSNAIKRLEHFTGCDMHIFHPDATSCDGKISTGECNHKRTCELIFEARKALAKPQRNCDVGTAEEHAKRWYWRYHVGHLCQSCPLGPRKWSEMDKGTLCLSEWLQKPYEAEEGGAK